MKVIIIEESKSVNNAKAKPSEKLYNQLRKQGIEVHLIESEMKFTAKPLSKKDKKKYFIQD